jgi:hypothetical protein
MLTRNLLTHYQSPDFAAEYSLWAATDLAAACGALRAIVDDLMAAGRAFLHPTSPNISLLELVNEPLSVIQLLTLARKFALRLEQCLC